MNKNEEIDYLINELISVNNSIDKNMEIPNDYSEKRKLLRALMNIQAPVKLSDEFYEIQDKLLSEETERKSLTFADEIKAISVAEIKKGLPTLRVSKDIKLMQLINCKIKNTTTYDI